MHILRRRSGLVRRFRTFAYSFCTLKSCGLFIANNSEDTINRWEQIMIAGLNFADGEAFDARVSPAAAFSVPDFGLFLHSVHREYHGFERTSVFFKIAGRGWSIVNNNDSRISFIHRRQWLTERFEYRQRSR